MNTTNFLNDFISDVSVPKFALIEQEFDRTQIENVEAEVIRQLELLEFDTTLLNNKSIAITAGSRQIDNIALVIKTVVAYLDKYGAKPFIIPAMGSHGSAVAENQKQILADMGITEEYTGAPVRASMDVVFNGYTQSGIPVYTDRLASEADGIVVVGRIKPHTSFHGKIESGIMKMITIGLGKQKGAATIHKNGIKHMAQNIYDSANLIIEKQNILFAVGLIENAFEKLNRIECMPASEIKDKEPELLLYAKSLMPSILFKDIDVLIVDKMGKNISGAGMDPNITRKNAAETGIVSEGEPERLVVLGLTEQSHGGATGMGTADIITRRLYNQIDYEKTYINNFTAGMLKGCSTPVTLENDEQAIKTAIKVLHYGDIKNPRIVRIEDTLHVTRILISHPMLEEARKNKNITVVNENYEFSYKDGNLIDYGKHF